MRCRIECISQVTTDGSPFAGVQDIEPLFYYKRATAVRSSVGILMGNLNRTMRNCCGRVVIPSDGKRVVLGCCSALRGHFNRAYPQPCSARGWSSPQASNDHLEIGRASCRERV